MRGELLLIHRELLMHEELWSMYEDSRGELRLPLGY